MLDDLEFLQAYLTLEERTHNYDSQEEQLTKGTRTKGAEFGAGQERKDLYQLGHHAPL
jgi:hypothetical protein